MLTERKFIRFFEKSEKKILILGIGGVSMSSIALMLQKQGCAVCGYDAVPGIFTDLVMSHSIPVVFSEDEIVTDDICCAVYTSAIREDSSIIRKLRENGIECVVRAKFLGELMKSFENRIGISGTHGKSTVSGMTASVFMEALRDPTVMIGAGLSGLEGGFRAGDTKDYIFEACEYRDSFLSFFPTISVVLNVELDHTDYFKNICQMKDSFLKFMNIATDSGGIALVNYDNENAKDCAERCSGKVFSFSARDKNSDAFAENIVFNQGKASFDVIIKGKKFVSLSLSVFGKFQVENALAAVCVAYLSGIAPCYVEKALTEYTGVARRFELRKFFNGAEIRDDYAHHPDEIRATLAAAKSAGYRRVFVAYQPHTYSRTHDLFDDFVKSFDDCDEVVFADIYAAREKNTFEITSKALADATPNGKYVGTFAEISQYFKKKLKDGDLLVIMGAGDIINLEI